MAVLEEPGASENNPGAHVPVEAFAWDSAPDKGRWQDMGMGHGL